MYFISKFIAIYVFPFMLTLAPFAYMVYRRLSAESVDKVKLKWKQTLRASPMWVTLTFIALASVQYILILSYLLT